MDYGSTLRAMRRLPRALTPGRTVPGAEGGGGEGESNRAKGTCLQATSPAKGLTLGWIPTRWIAAACCSWSYSFHLRLLHLRVCLAPYTPVSITPLCLPLPPSPLRFLAPSSNSKRLTPAAPACSC